eukprot:1317171-Rhodomonas_salina.1
MSRAHVRPDPPPSAMVPGPGAEAGAQRDRGNLGAGISEFQNTSPKTKSEFQHALYQECGGFRQVR